MRASIERFQNLNDLIDSVPQEIVRRMQREAETDQAPLTESSSMTNEKKISKSKRIRDYIEEHAAAKPKDIVEALSQYGVTVSDVGNVRAKLKDVKSERKSSDKNASSKNSSRPVAQPSAASGINLKALEHGTMFLKEAGSLSNARELLIVIDRIRSV